MPFSLTKDQLNALKDIEKDLHSKEARRRVIMGDVGCGKTLVLLGAALMVYPKQAILMAPTSILAHQLYEEAKKILPDFMNILFIKGVKRKRFRTKYSKSKSYYRYSCFNSFRKP